MISHRVLSFDQRLRHRSAGRTRTNEDSTVGLIAAEMMTETAAEIAEVETTAAGAAGTSEDGKQEEIGEGTADRARTDPGGEGPDGAGPRGPVRPDGRCEEQTEVHRPIQR